MHFENREKKRRGGWGRHKQNRAKEERGKEGERRAQREAAFQALLGWSEKMGSSLVGSKQSLVKMSSNAKYKQNLRILIGWEQR